MHPPGTPKTSKNAVLLQHNWWLEGFGVPGECKSILNVKCLHKSHIAELFGPRVFCFSVGRICFLAGKNSGLFAPPLFFLSYFFWIGRGAIKPEFEVVDKVQMVCQSNDEFSCECFFIPYFFQQLGYNVIVTLVSLM